MKRFFILVVCGLAVLSILVAIVSWLSWQPQSWYDPPDFSRSEVAKLADRAEYRLNEEFHKVRPLENTWRLRIQDEAMNAWLAGRLEGWLTHDQQIEMPKEVHEPQVHVATDGIWIAAYIDIDGKKPRPLAMQLWVWVDDGMVFVEPIAVRLGKIPIPMSLFDAIIVEMNEKTQGIRATVPLMDDRRVEITSVELEDGALVITCHTKLP